MYDRVINIIYSHQHIDDYSFRFEIDKIVNEYKNMTAEEQYNVLKNELVYPCMYDIPDFIKNDENLLDEVVRHFSNQILTVTKSSVINRLIEEDENNFFYATKNSNFRVSLNPENRKKYINYLISNDFDSYNIKNILNEEIYEDLFDKDTLINLLNHEKLFEDNGSFLYDVLNKLPIEDLKDNIIKAKNIISNYMHPYDFIQLLRLLPEEDRLEIFNSVFPDVLDDSISNENKTQLLDVYFDLTKDPDFKYQYLFKNFSKIYQLTHQDTYMVVEYFRFLNSEQITSIIDRYNDIFVEDPWFLVSILTYCDAETKNTYFNKYKDVIKNDYNAICIYIGSLPKSQMVHSIIEFKEYIESKNLIDLFFKIDDDKEKIIFLDNCIDKIDRDNLFLRILYRSKDENKKNILKNFFKYYDEKLNEKYENFKKLDENKYDYIFDKLSKYNNEVLLLIINFHKNNLELFDTPEKVIKSFDIIDNIINSNSSEIRHIYDKILKIILNEPFEKWETISNNIEDIFLKNNTPYVGKIYKVFELMHPDAFVNGTISPNLKARGSITSRKIIIFSDLLKCAIGSNNRDFNEYLNSIVHGNQILCNLINGTSNIANLDEHDSELFTIYINHLNTLYNCTEEGLKNPRKLKNNMIADAYELLSLFMKNERNDFKVEELPNRIIKMFAHFAGFDTVEDIINYRNDIIKKAEERNIKRARENNFKIEKGDYYKGLVNEERNEKDFYYSFLIDILQNGSLCKEFLGSAARSDTTPLDTDLSRILNIPLDFSSPFIDYYYAASRYGPLWFVLKNDERLNYSSKTGKYDKDKLEVFETSMDGSGHYGIRTGFASTDIDFFVVDEQSVKLYRIKNAIAMNGFYIPIVNTKGKLVFTPEEYQDLRKNMQGLSHYGCNNYEFAKELDTFDSSKEDYSTSNNSSNVEKEKNLIINKLASTGLKITNKRMPYIENGVVELLDIGSTGRGTNCSDDYDFDFILRVDRGCTKYPNKYHELRKHIEEAFPDVKFIDDFKIRELPVNVDGHTVKIDITIIPKDDKIEYTTDECVVDRLNTIKKIDSEKHQKVLQNIVLAKEVLKSAGVYKSRRSRYHAQGGLGGVGVETWILENGGSFEKAARTFLEVADSSENFEDFNNKYKVFDYGENHMYYNQKDHYKHFDFIEHNMDPSGYNRMKEALREYLNKLDNKKKKEKQL